MDNSIASNVYGISDEIILLSLKSINMYLYKSKFDSK